MMATSIVNAREVLAMVASDMLALVELLPSELREQPGGGSISAFAGWKPYVGSPG